MTNEQEFEHVRELVEARNESHGDATLVVLAALLAGKTEPVHRSYVMEKLRAARGPHPEKLLDVFGLKRFRTALEEHANDPIQWLAESSGNSRS